MIGSPGVWPSPPRASIVAPEFTASEPAPMMPTAPAPPPTDTTVCAPPVR
jgi:hypothetical protein